MPTLLAEARPRSRGKVRCDLCGHLIPAGVVYTQQSLADDGRAYKWRECPVCEDAAAGFMEANPSDWWVDGYGTDTIDEWARDNPDDPRAVAYLARRTGGSTPDTGTPADLPRCPDCGATHDPEQCAREHGGGVSCDCCRAIAPATPDTGSTP